LAMSQEGTGIMIKLDGRIGRTRWTCLVAVIVVVAGLSNSTYALPQGVRAVNGDISECPGNGLEWSTAYKYLQDAIEFASTPGSGVTQIWVKGETLQPYYPDRDCDEPDGCTPRPCALSTSFMMIPGVRLFGGFNGTETAVTERPTPLKETILSGDIDEDDVLNANNSWHVLKFIGDNILENPNTVVDGFTITAGNARGPGQELFVENAGGGALLLKNTVPTPEAAVPGPVFKTCRFIGNRADAFGGAIAGRNIGVTVDDCYFEGNDAQSNLIASPILPMRGGGGVSLNGPANIVRSNFFQNTSDACGGALDFDTSDLIRIVNCKFWENTADDEGGAVDVTSNTGFIVNCLFAGNTSFGTVGQNGGGVSGRLDVINCTFIDNHAKDTLIGAEVVADAVGGGMWVGPGTAVISSFSVETLVRTT